MKPADAARAIPRGPTAVGPLRHGQETYANPFLAWPAGRIVQLCPGQALLPGAIWGKGPTKGRGKKRPVALAHNGANGNNKQRPAGQQPFGESGRHVWPCKTGRAEPPNGILWWQWCVERGMSVLCLPDAHRPFPQPFSVPMMPFTAFGRHSPILRDAARQLRLHDDRLLPLKSIRCGNLAVCEKNLLQDGILPFCIYIRLCHPSRLSQRFAANVRNIG